MIFKPEMVDKILAGEKTVTRRPVKEQEVPWGCGETGCPRNWQKLPCRYEVGKDYAVQPGRGKKAVGRIGQENSLDTIDRFTPEQARELAGRLNKAADEVEMDPATPGRG